MRRQIKVRLVRRKRPVWKLRLARSNKEAKRKIRNVTSMNGAPKQPKAFTMKEESPSVVSMTLKNGRIKIYQSRKKEGILGKRSL